jgi:acyl-CoA thioester hydrolase
MTEAFLFLPMKSKGLIVNIAIDWAELDLFGHVNNVAFFRYLQNTRVQYCQAIGITVLNETGKPGFVVASSKCQFLKPLYFPGQVQVMVKTEWIKNSSFQLSYQLFNQHNEKVAEAEDVLVLYDYSKGSKMLVPIEIRERISALDQNTPGVID